MKGGNLFLLSHIFTLNQPGFFFFGDVLYVVVLIAVWL